PFDESVVDDENAERLRRLTRRELDDAGAEGVVALLLRRKVARFEFDARHAAGIAGAINGERGTARNRVLCDAGSWTAELEDACRIVVIDRARALSDRDRSVDGVSQVNRSEERRVG